MKSAYIFPGQGSQFKGMGLDLYQSSDSAKTLFDQANSILGFDITKIMFEGSDEELKQTNVTQPAIFIHSVILAKISPDFTPNMVAGHSLGEFSALVAAGALSFEDGLKLVAKRADAMQKACEIRPSTMAAILGLADNIIEEVCAGITDEIVVPANYNCPGQVVISGTFEGVEKACELLKAAGAKRALILPVGGAFHSPLMEPAREELASAIHAAEFEAPICAIYQNVNAMPATEVNVIKENLISQLTAPVRWTQTIEQMVNDGAETFIECGPGKVLQGLVKKIASGVEIKSI
ncbi:MULTISPECIES: ACP S-malonyltransferase [unclassified Dyadobacter]|jgi:[acyl-carrier-protein] S-malonyltransferase|uniref:ACP S-malonyltransferase n=1 Tax=unclassified Dyadobacter TaxID=2625061 RepID=UPI001F17537C|nr:MULTISPECIES: ACP S-malonyltransferase [unclassified Dyadobacter]MCE7068817.1 ACP S-malonyltransferase [Dyadobacter sp. CY327]MCF2520124.1 ACP S-malonyltransferase [Dyadobacter sp. CY351]